MYILNHYSLVMCFIQKPAICFALQNKWLLFIWTATLDWNRILGLLLQEFHHGIAVYVDFFLRICKTFVWLKIFDGSADEVKV